MTLGYLTPAQVAEYLAVTQQTVRNLISDKKLRALRVGRVWRIRRDALEEFERRRDGRVQRRRAVAMEEADHRPGPEVTCKHCGVTVERQELGAGKVQRFCTNRCAGLAAQAAGTFRGENNPRFAGWKSRDKVAYRKRFQARYPEKASAHRAVAYALQRGTLVRGPCEACGAELAQAHHDDYSRKLDVRWLCRPCHRAWHQANDRPMGSAGVRRAVP